MDVTNSIDLTVRIDAEALGIPPERYQDAEELISMMVAQTKVKMAFALRELQVEALDN